MLKRICDRCEKEMQDDAYWFSFKVDKMQHNCIYCSDGHFELCEHCFLVFKKDLAN